MKWSPQFETYLQETITKYTGIPVLPYLPFTTIREKLVDEFVKENLNWNVDDHKKYLSKPFKHSIFCEPVTTYEFSRVNTDLKISKSPGPDEISPKLIKEIVTEIS